MSTPLTDDVIERDLEFAIKIARAAGQRVLALRNTERWEGKLMADIGAFQSADQSTDEFKMLGNRLVENMTKNLFFIGVVQSPAPLIHRNVLKNVTDFKTHSYEYYRTYPYRGPQWWLDE